MKICITAANCYIGLPLVKKAAELGWEVIAVVRVGNKQKDFIGTILYIMQVIHLQKLQVRQLFQFLKIIKT